MFEFNYYYLVVFMDEAGLPEEHHESLKVNMYKHTKHIVIKMMRICSN